MKSSVYSFFFLFPSPPEDIFSVGPVLPSQSAMEPVKQVRVETKVTMKVPVRVYEGVMV